MALYLSHQDTTQLEIDVEKLIQIFEETHTRLASGQGTYHPRIRLVHPPISGNGTGRPWKQNMRILPAMVAGMGAGLRVGGSSSRRVGSGGSLLVLFDFETMALKVIISDFLVHGIRSGVPDGLAAKHLSRKDSTVLGVIGSGRVAHWGTLAVSAVRPINLIKVFSPNRDHRQNFARNMEKELKIRAIDFESPEAVVRDSHIVVTATNTATGPVLKGAWLSPGCTVISNTPEELDPDTFRRAKIVVGMKEEVCAHVPPYPSIQTVLDSGDLTEADLSLEIADVISGILPGRESEKEIISYLNPGCGIYDVAVASYMYQRAQEQKLGTSLPT
jgi:alanine dehydrogenase